jgi:hypothetical protein
MNYLVSCFAYNFKKANTKEEEVKSLIGAIMLLPPVALLGFIILNGFYQMYEMLF